MLNIDSSTRLERKRQHIMETKRHNRRNYKIFFIKREDNLIFSLFLSRETVWVLSLGLKSDTAIFLAFKTVAEVMQV